ncbi:MAG: hypothetical protein LBL73_07110 [Synergistaceae bacterium]|jgi:hypothetical protein|nr:hypothetical protein [Synergistaceae bacterium]
MNDGEDWLMRPVLEGLCRYEGLADGTLSLEDLLVMNQALDVKHENERRWLDHEKNKR